MIALLLTAAPAWATLYSVSFCLEFDTTWADNGVGEDYWTTDTDRTARGVWLSVEENGTATEKYTPHYVDDSTGCATVGLDSTRSYRVKAKSSAYVSGVYLHAYDDDTSPASLYTVFYTAFVPSSSTTYDLDIPDTDNRNVLLSVATWAMSRGHGMSTPVTIDFYSTGGSSSGPHHDMGDVYYNTTSARKYIITHEIGHAIAFNVDEGAEPNFSYDAAENYCDGDGAAEDSHGQVSKEYQSAAAVEGWGDFYSAITWNTTADSDCFYGRHYSSDFDLDFEDDNSGTVDCEGRPVATGIESYVSGRDWLADLVAAADPMGCTTPMPNRGVQYDWLRFFWDMTTDEGVSYADLVDLWDAMDARSFDDNGSTSTVTDDPTERLLQAAALLGLTPEYANQMDNGVDH